jgi:hypothetical protein
MATIIFYQLKSLEIEWFDPKPYFYNSILIPVFQKGARDSSDYSG